VQDILKGFVYTTISNIPKILVTWL